MKPRFLLFGFSRVPLVVPLRRETAHRVMGSRADCLAIFERGFHRNQITTTTSQVRAAPVTSAAPCVSQGIQGTLRGWASRTSS